jgi:small conductance mechanosensitive channel
VSDVRPLAVTSLSDVSNWLRGSLPLVVLLVVGAILITRLANWASERFTHRIEARGRATDALVRSEAMKHQHAVGPGGTRTRQGLIYCIAAVLIVELFGIPLTGFVAPATVAGVALGFGAQRIVQDILSGFFIVTERQYGYGDVVRLSVTGTGQAPQTGAVEEVTLRITRIRTADGEVVTTPNGQIVQVTNLSRDWARAVVDVPVPVSADVNRVSEVLRAVCEEAFADGTLHPLMLDAPSVMGVESLEVDQFNVRVVARTLPGKQFEIGRALRARITRALLREGISVAPAIQSDGTGEPDDGGNTDA